MKASHLPPITQQIQTAPFWLLAIAAGLAAIQITLASRLEDGGLMALSGLCWLAVGSLLWEKYTQLKFNSGIFASTLGVLLIVGVLLKSTILPSQGFLAISPFLSALGVGLLASGFRNLRQYWRELVILFFIGWPHNLLKAFLEVPTTLGRSPLDLSIPTANLGTLLLVYTGFDVKLQGVVITLPGGSVEVNEACSGVDTMFYLLSLAVLFLVMFPLKERWKTMITPLVAVTLAFLVNGARVALLAVVSAQQDKEAFNYWHHGQGSLLSTMCAVFLFGIFCWFIQQDLQSADPDPVDVTCP
jgi:cyanoexosortase A